jgi:hypothetical protein
LKDLGIGHVLNMVGGIVGSLNGFPSSGKRKVPCSKGKNGVYSGDFSLRQRRGHDGKMAHAVKGNVDGSIIRK